MKKSYIDLIIVSENLEKYLDKVIIDTERKFSPYHAMKDKRLTYSDHYPLLLSMKNIPMKIRKNLSIQKETIWNTNRPGGWNQYKLLTEYNENLDNINNDVSPEKMMNATNREMNRIMYKSFGKAKLKI